MRRRKQIKTQIVKERRRKNTNYFALSDISQSLSLKTTDNSAYIDAHGSVANWSLGQIFITSIQISLIIFLLFVLGFQKRIASICL